MKRLILQFVLASLLVVGWAAAIANPPAESGSFVVRYEEQTGFIQTDFEGGYNIVFGIDPREFCAEIYNFDTFAFQEITLPDMERLTQFLKGEVRAFVWPFTGPDDYECEVWLTVPPLLEGMAKFRSMEQHGGRTTVAQGWIGHGLLLDRTGAQTPFTSIFRLVVDVKADEARVLFFVTQIGDH
jgi:hypothetical protein